jgi:dUTP pyrophosphatase
MIQAARRLMCDKFSVLCTLKELNEKQLREDDRMQVRIKRLNENAIIPQYAHDYDAGVDLVATEDVVVEPGDTIKVPTGIAVSIPPGYEATVRPRSGITLNTKLRVQLGTIDAGYNGELGVVVDNVAHPYFEIDEDGEIHKPKRSHLWTIDGGTTFTPGRSYVNKTYHIRKGDRIGQLVFAPIEQAQFVEVDALEETQRGEGGFGSSGVK